VFDAQAFQRYLTTRVLGREMIYRPVIDSTNTLAHELIVRGAATGTLVLTDEQPQGRGRAGRTWHCQAGQDLLLSLLLRPAYPPQFLMMATAVAVIAASRAVTDVKAAIKWPNDVLIDGRKVAGILIETGHDTHKTPFAIVGVGINVNGTAHDVPELATMRTTLQEACGHPVSREQLLAAFLAELENRSVDLDTGETTAQRVVQREWRQLLTTLGQVVQVRQGNNTVQGLAIDTDSDGRLYVQQPGGEVVCVTWGDIITGIPPVIA